MREAHKLNITTSAMMFGHVETIEERFEHLVWIREVQSEKANKRLKVLINFIPWPYMDDGTFLQRVKGVNNSVSDDEYIRTINK